MTGEPLINPANMSRWWGIDAVATANGASTQISAAQWSIVEAFRELSGEPDEKTHVLSTILRGSASVQMFYDGKLSHNRTIRAGDTTLVAAGRRPLGVLSACDLDAMHIYLPNQLLLEAASEDGRTAATFDFAMNGPCRDAEIHQVAQRISAEMNTPRPASRMLIDGLGLQLAAHLLRRWSTFVKPVPTRGGLTPLQLRRVTEFLIAHLADDVGLRDAAAVTGLSVKHFARAFKQSTGLAPHQWVIAKRIEQVKSLLSTSGEPLAEIALSCGFSDQSHLTTVFRKITGTTPGRYRAGAIV